MDISAFVDDVIKQFSTTNPFLIADQLNISTIKEPLGSVKGYYCKLLGNQFIHISSDIPYYEQRLVCAHELAHALLHPNISLKYTLFSISKYERPANQFAVFLLLKDAQLYYPDYDIFKLARIAGIPDIALKTAFT